MYWHCIHARVKNVGSYGQLDNICKLSCSREEREMDISRSSLLH